MSDFLSLTESNALIQTLHHVSVPDFDQSYLWLENNLGSDVIFPDNYVKYDGKQATLCSDSGPYEYNKMAKWDYTVAPHRNSVIGNGFVFRNLSDAIEFKLRFG